MVPWLWRGPRQLQQKWDTTSTYPGSKALTLEPSSRKHQSYSAWNSVKCVLPFLLPCYSNTEILSYANMSGPAGHWQSLRGTRLQELLMKGVFWSGQQPKAVSYCNISVQIDGQHLARGQGEGKGEGRDWESWKRRLQHCNSIHSLPSTEYSTSGLSENSWSVLLSSSGNPSAMDCSEARELS